MQSSNLHLEWMPLGQNIVISGFLRSCFVILSLFFQVGLGFERVFPGRQQIDNRTCCLLEDKTNMRSLVGLNLICSCRIFLTDVLLDRNRGHQHSKIESQLAFSEFAPAKIAAVIWIWLLSGEATSSHLERMGWKGTLVMILMSARFSTSVMGLSVTPSLQKKPPGITSTSSLRTNPFPSLGCHSWSSKRFLSC